MQKFINNWLEAVGDGSLIEVRCLDKIKNRPPRRGWFSKAYEALAYMRGAKDDGYDVYIGANPRKIKDSGEDAVACPLFIWSDIDCGEDRIEQAERDVMALGPKPWAIVRTGGGVHAWWLLDSPASKEKWHEAMRIVCAAVHGDKNALDLPRILRAPGTINHKYSPARVCEVSFWSGEKSSLADFLAVKVEEELPPMLSLSIKAHDGGNSTPFSRAKDVPIVDVFTWLGIKMHQSGRRIFCACPIHNGTNDTQCVVGGDRNVATCFGDCSGKYYTNVDVVAARLGITPNEAVARLAEQFGFEGFAKPKLPPIQPQPAQVSLSLTQAGLPKPTFANLCAVLREGPEFKGKLSYNLMDLKPYLDGKPIGEMHSGLIREMVELRYGFAPGIDALHHAIRTVSEEANPWHPVRDYLGSLKWDGVKRCASLCLDALHVGGRLEGLFVLKWLISAVARAYKPGCKADSALVVVGKQGLYKSTFFEALGGEFFADSRMDLTKSDSFLQLHSAWIYEWAEIDGITSQTKASSVKAFMTSSADTFRAPYERAVQTHPRSVVLCGTTNENKFLVDQTGSRRFWIVEIAEKANIALVRECRDQIWAEARHLYEAGVPWHLSADEEAQREEQAKEFEVEDPWEAAVGDALKFKDYPLSVSKVMELMDIPAERWTKSMSTRIGQCMAKIGWTRGLRVRGAEGRVVLWNPPAKGAKAEEVFPEVPVAPGASVFKYN